LLSVRDVLMWQGGHTSKLYVSSWKTRPLQRTIYAAKCDDTSLGQLRC